MRFWVGILLLLITSTVQAVSDDAVLTLLNSRCVKCHGKDGKVKGKINLLNQRVEDNEKRAISGVDLRLQILSLFASCGLNLLSWGLFFCSQASLPSLRMTK